MATLKQWHKFLVTIGGEKKEGGSVSAEVDRTMAGGVYEVIAQVADNYAVEMLWDAGHGNIDNWDWLFILSDEDVILELTYDRAGAGEVVCCVYVTADVPMMINGDAIYGTALVAGDATTTVACDQIRVKNNQADEAGDATIRLVLIEA